MSYPPGRPDQYAAHSNKRHLDMLVKKSEHSYKFLNLKFGVECKVYFPKEGVKTTYQEYDESLEYELTPSYEGRLIIPAIYNMRAKGTEAYLDSIEDDQILYLPNSLSFPRNSLIVPDVAPNLVMSKALNFRVQSVDEISPSAWYRKAQLVSAAKRTTAKENPEGSTVDDDIEMLPLQSEVDSESIKTLPSQTRDPQKNVVPRRPLLVKKP